MSIKKTPLKNVESIDQGIELANRIATILEVRGSWFHFTRMHKLQFTSHSDKEAALIVAYTPDGLISFEFWIQE